MAKYHYFSLLTVYSFLLGGVWFSELSVFVAAGTEGEGDSPTATTCLTGWNSNSETAIPEKWMNDGYCDCPFDGKDEPSTNACSGSLSWAGVDTATRYVAKNRYRVWIGGVSKICFSLQFGIHIDSSALFV